METKFIIYHIMQSFAMISKQQRSELYNGPSLNDCLHVGPKFGQDILALLIRFRLHKHAFIADIEKAFLMIAVEKSDRDALRFLWFRDVKENSPQIQVFRFARVTFGVA